MIIDEVKRGLRLLGLGGMKTHWIKKSPDSWLVEQLTGKSFAPPEGPYKKQIEEIARTTNSLGQQELWEGYGADNDRGATRTPNQVRNTPVYGNLFTHLVVQKKVKTVVEFGAAFGVSGMHFLAGLMQNKSGRLLSFEPNESWSAIAESNLKKIGDRFTLTVGTFEDNVESVLGTDGQIDLALIDAIHTKEFVIPQLEIVLSYCHSGSIIIFDDVDFSDEMRECWDEVANYPIFSSSVRLGERVGLAEVR